jgi:hypothetical protein
MGGCFSDMKGAKQAVGGVVPQTAPNNNNNDAVDFFYTAQGFQPLFTQVEVPFLVHHHSYGGRYTFCDFLFTFKFFFSFISDLFVQMSQRSSVCLILW